MVSAEHRGSGGYIARRLRSFPYAFRGLVLLFREPNARIHTLAAILVFWVAFFLHLSPLEWAAIVVAIVLVFGAEAFNTALEALADAAVPELHPKIGAAKDLGAAAVLIAALGSVAIGCLVLGPHLWDLSMRLR